MGKFKEIVEDMDLTVLDKEQKRVFLRSIHRFGCATAESIAFDSTTLVVKDGNLDYYAGLEYDEPSEIYKNRGDSIIKVYEVDRPVLVEDEEAVDSRITELIQKCMRVEKGLPIE